MILDDFTSYAHTQLRTTLESLGVPKTERFLVDAYCGSGLFSVTCSEGFKSVIGVEISADSVKYAIRNATANGIANASFLTGSADKIFEVVQTPPDQTALIIDPPRKVRTQEPIVEAENTGVRRGFLGPACKIQSSSDHLRVLQCAYTGKRYWNLAQRGANKVHGCSGQRI